MPRTLLCSRVKSPVTLRPNQTSRKTDTTTASSPTPPARTASVSRLLLAEPLNDASLAASPASACNMAPKTASEAAFHAVAFTGTGVPARARQDLALQRLELLVRRRVDEGGIPARRLAGSSESAWFISSCRLAALLMNNSRAPVSSGRGPLASAPSTRAASLLPISSASTVSMVPIAAAWRESSRSSVDA